MPTTDHPAYREERERLDYTLDYVGRSLEATLRKKTALDQEIKLLDKACTDENSQAYIDLIVKTNIQGGLASRLRNLNTARSRPYFARIDFLENGADETETLYIGKMCLMREEDQKLVIVDWRASVANLYYQGRLGRTAYSCPGGEIEGELRLKRQFSIDGGELRELFDIDITTNDEFLATCLGANADTRLKEIVSTIQEEQNRIIRADMERPLIVQGVAGSGKTTIALHRLAYLIYHCGKSFQPENFMIIAPNRLFLNYISEVLPELGVERVKQSTFEDFAREIIGTGFAIKDANEKLLLLQEKAGTPADKKQRRLLHAAAVFKSSLAYKDLLEHYIRDIEETLLPAEGLRLDDWVFCSAGEVREFFYRDYRDWPAFKRLEMFKRRLAMRVKDRTAEIAQELQEKCNADVRQIKAAMEESEVRRQFILQTIERKEELVRRLEELASSGVKEYCARAPRRNVLDFYRAFLEDPACAARLSEVVKDEELNPFILSYSLGNLKAGQVELEDIAPLLYLKYRLFGLDEKIRLKHLVIDEAQDFSSFQLYALRKLLRESSFTLLGDLAQGIHSYRGTRDWEEVHRDVFGDCGAELLTLKRSYRTTAEIMSAANLVLGCLADPRLLPARPVLRTGEAVGIIVEPGEAPTARDMADKIREALDSGYKTSAVVCKTMPECHVWHDWLMAEGLDTSIVTGKEAEYRGGVSVVPAYLAKGLEFDLVLIADADQDNYGENELDVKLLYVAMTRALHRLYIYCRGELTPLLQDLPKH